MSKIKLNLASGVSVEKPLITAFVANENKYLVLDNEMNGSMGLPIILVCKIVDNKITKIVDPTEWNSVKEYLKQIIAGNNLENISIEQEVNADDIYYTQLTLPLPSFDALKNSYTAPVATNIEQTTEPVVPMMENAQNTVPAEPEFNLNQPVIEPVFPMGDAVNVNNDTVGIQDIMNTPVVDNTPSIEPVIPEPIPVINNVPEEPTAGVENPMPVIEPISMPDITNMMPPVSEPVVENPVIEPAINIIPKETSQVEATPVVDINPQPVETSEPVAPVVESNVNVQTESKFASQKEAFMEACSNMFDALVQKFEKELENKEN